MAEQFKDQTIIITGATKGIGRAMAAVFGANGANILATGRTEDELDSICREVERAGAQAVPLVADLARETPVEITPRRGDVVFIDSLMAHSGSLNRSAQPRLALRFLCSCPECEGWHKVGKWNVWNP